MALDGVDIEVEAGSMCLLIVPNGSGKTTLINTVTGVYKPDHGEIFFDGRNITRLKPHEIYRLGLVRTWQIPQPFQSLTVLENLLVSDKQHPAKDSLQHYLDDDGLNTRLKRLRKPTKYSSYSSSTTSGTCRPSS